MFKSPLSKLTTLALTLALGSGSAFAQTTLTFWHALGDDDLAMLQKLTGEYTAAHPDVKVSLLFVPFDQLQKKIALAIPAGQGPDIFLGVHDSVGTNAVSRLIVPVEQYLNKSAFIDSTIQAASYGGHIWGFPQSYETTTLVYNPKLVKTPPRTLDEMLKVAKANTGNGSYGFVYDIANFYYSYGWLSAQDAKPLFKDDGTFQLGTQPMQGFLTQLKAFQSAGVMPKEPNHDVAMSLFGDGKAAMVITGPWGTTGLKKNKKDFALSPLPTVNGKVPKPFMGVKLYYITQQSKHATEAAALLTYITNAKSEGAWTVATGMLPANKAAYQQPGVKDDKVVLGFSKQAENAIPMGNIPQFGAIWDPAKEAIQKVLYGNISAEAAAQVWEDKVKSAK
ncbi:sugar ABC transporter substrate-binding protein [Deinococcus sp.]|uniref:sugar ABC transporter substrate-binding protein n=1 Tax=Deinococcus sp. TaxID=47478 RepID=UPI003B5A2306